MDLRYLEMKELDIDKEREINEQVLAEVYEVFKEVELGYHSNDQKEMLITNAEKLKNTLCFVQKYWKVLLHAEYPHIPTEGFKYSRLLNTLAVADLNRSKKKT